MSVASNALAVAVIALGLAVSGPAIAEDQADDANSGTTKETTSAPTVVIQSANVAATNDFCKELDPANAAAFDAIHQKELTDAGPEFKDAMLHPDFEKLKNRTLAFYREQSKKPGGDIVVKKGCQERLTRK